MSSTIPEAASLNYVTMADPLKRQAICHTDEDVCTISLGELSLTGVGYGIWSRIKPMAVLTVESMSGPLPVCPLYRTTVINLLNNEIRLLLSRLDAVSHRLSPHWDAWRSPFAYPIRLHSPGGSQFHLV